MILITILTLLLAISLSGRTISPTNVTRLAAIGLLFAAALSYSSVDIHTHSCLDAGVGVFGGLLHASVVTQLMETFLFLTAALILLTPIAIPGYTSNTTADASAQTPDTLQKAYIEPVSEYSLIALFSVAGSVVLLSSSDLVTLFLGIELQSFGVYVLASVYRDSETATNAGLKYFLLGAVSSALILLGAGLVYGYTGLTNLDALFELVSTSGIIRAETSISQSLGLVLGVVLISVGLLFKVAAAPFHFWAPDVYDGVPTLVTTWLTTMPKLAIFTLLLELYSGANSAELFSPALQTNFNSAPYNLLVACAFLSIVVGTVLGLTQTEIKRLLAYSTISHVGFMLLALSIASSESVDALMFYLVQYTITVVDSFLILIAFGYVIPSKTFVVSGASGENGDDGTPIRYVMGLAGQWAVNPILTLSMAICFFSMAGIPPLMGFYAKYSVLLAAINADYFFLSITAILTSVVSAAYYLRVIQLTSFDAPVSIPSANDGSTEIATISSLHAYSIAVLTLFIMLFAVNPNLLLNITRIMALSMHSS